MEKKEKGKIGQFIEKNKKKIIRGGLIALGVIGSIVTVVLVSNGGKKNDGEEVLELETVENDPTDNVIQFDEVASL